MLGFLRSLTALAPLLLQIAPSLIPGLHPAAVPHILAAVQTAEQIPGATGSQKLSAAVAIATHSLSVAQAQGAPIDADALSSQIPGAVQSVVDVVNSFKSHHAALAAPPPSA